MSSHRDDARTHPPGVRGRHADAVEGSDGHERDAGDAPTHDGDDGDPGHATPSHPHEPDHATPSHPHEHDHATPSHPHEHDHATPSHPHEHDHATPGHPHEHDHATPGHPHEHDHAAPGRPHEPGAGDARGDVAEDGTEAGADGTGDVAASAPTTPLGRDDPAFPLLHPRPALGWVNDPNGCCVVDGRTHVFFQHNPDAPHHAAIAWGHVSSDDLVRWREEPVALRPRPGGPDALGCWSGCVILDHGTPTAVYSASADDRGRTTVVLARGDRSLRRWRQDDEPVLAWPGDPSLTEVRDPFVLTVDGRRWAVQGAGHRDGGPRVLAWSCDDLEQWHPAGTLLSDDDPVAARVAPADAWECPNVVRVDGRWAVVVSQWRWVDGEASLDAAAWLLGDLDVTDDGPRFVAAQGGPLDLGTSLYAPHVFADPDRGRVLYLGWVREHDRPEPDVQRAGWAGSLTFPRELFVAGDRLASRPVPELASLRAAPLDVAADGTTTARAFELALAPTDPATTDPTTPDPATTDPAPTDPTTSDDQRVELTLVDGDEVLRVVDVRPHPSRTSPPRVFVDGSVVEVFDGGPAPRTLRAYPTATSRWRIAATPGAVTAAWRLALPGS